MRAATAGALWLVGLAALTGCGDPSAGDDAVIRSMPGRQARYPSATVLREYRHGSAGNTTHEVYAVALGTADGAEPVLAWYEAQLTPHGYRVERDPSRLPARFRIGYDVQRGFERQGAWIVVSWKREPCHIAGVSSAHPHCVQVELGPP